MRIRYVADAVTPQVAVWEMRDLRSSILRGWITQDATGRWTAKLATDARKTVPGWLRRSDAAAWLMLSSQCPTQRVAA